MRYPVDLAFLEDRVLHEPIQLVVFLLPLPTLNEVRLLLFPKNDIFIISAPKFSGVKSKVDGLEPK